MFGSRGGREVSDQDGDRRLPILQSIRVGGTGHEHIPALRFVHENDKIDGWDHVQYLGEQMVSACYLMPTSTSKEL